MRGWSVGWRTAMGNPVFRELADARDGVDRRTVRAGMRAARRGEVAPDPASARVAVARARAIRAGVGDGDEFDDRRGWRVAFGVLAVVWLGLAVAADTWGAAIWPVVMATASVAQARENPARRFARARRAEAGNRALLWDRDAPYDLAERPVFVDPPPVATVTAGIVLGAGCIVTGAVLAGAAGETFPPAWDDAAFGVGVAGVLLLLLWWGGRTRADRAESPPPFEG